MRIRRSVASLLLFLALSAVSAAAAPILSMTPASQTVNVGDTLTVNIDVTDIVDLFAYQFDLAFDPNILLFQSITEGSFLQDGIIDPTMSGTFFDDGDVDLGTGIVSLVFNSLVAQETGVSGSGTLAIATFLATMAGTASITFPNPETDSNLLLIDSTFTQMAVSEINSGTVQVRQPTSSVPEETSLMILLAASLSLAAFRCVARVS